MHMVGVDESIKYANFCVCVQHLSHVDCERLKSKNFTGVSLTETGVNIKHFLIYD